MPYLEIDQRPLRIEYDFILVYPNPGEITFKVGNEVKSPIKDGAGSLHCFDPGIGDVVFTTWHSWRGSEVFVKLRRPKRDHSLF